MASTHPIKVGVIGFSTQGWAASSHGPALAHPSLHSNLTVTAVHTSSEKSAAAAKDAWEKTWPSLKPYHGSDASGIANDPDVDVAAISVKAPDHKAVVDKVITAGKDFFIEYPVGRSLAEGEEILRQVQANGKIRVAVGLQTRQAAFARKVKKLIDAGKIGKILSTTVVANMPREVMACQPLVLHSREYLADKNSGATVMIIPAGHQLDTLIYLLGRFASVSGTTSTQYPTYDVVTQVNTGDGAAHLLPGSESIEPASYKIVQAGVPSNGCDHFSFSGPLVSGAHASVTWRSGTVSTPGRTQFLWIIDGETGSIKFDSDATAPTPGALISMFDPKVTVNGQPLDEYLVAEGIEYSDSQLVLEDGEQGNFVASVRRSWLEFAKTLRGGKGEEATLDDAIEVKRVVDAVERSAAQGGLSIKLN